MKCFVYGTLKQGYNNNHILSSSVLVKEAIVDGYKLYYSGFPVAAPCDESMVKGEIWDIGDDEQVLERLDRLEGVPWLYTREKVTTKCGEEVSMYVGNPASWTNFKGMRECHTEDKLHWWDSHA